VLQKLRNAIGNAIMTGLEVTGSVVSLSGAAVAIVLGKLFAATVLAALTLGIFLRLSGRRKPPREEPLPTPPSIQFASAFLSVVEVAVLTEATNLPVRLIQPGFEKMNWLLVILALLVMYFIQVRFFRSVLVKRNASTQPTQP
jgi:hypothetical protein